jgi:hypothetical protein
MHAPILSSLQRELIQWPLARRNSMCLNVQTRRAGFFILFQNRLLINRLLINRLLINRLLINRPLIGSHDLRF